MIKGIIGACIGGALGAALWGAIAYFTGYEVGILAWVVGGMVGFGMALGAKDNTDNITGAAAAGIAIAALLVGKYMAVSLYVDKAINKEAARVQITADDAKKYVAWQLVEEYKSQSKPLKWPDGQTEETAEDPEHFPKDLWADMESRWAALTPTQQEGYRNAAEDDFKKAVAAVSGAAKQEGFLSTFSFYDIIFFFLALITAFKLGAGFEGGDSD
ncbi:MAG: hypothetical protein U0637_01510 [Phycisphaerales bacterium]